MTVSYTVIVFVKQVPDTQNISGEAMTPQGTVNRAALPAIFNPEDLNALELALQLKDRYNARVIVGTMGPPNAAEVLRNALYRGADEAFLLTDRAFAGADTLATSYALSCAAKKYGKFDLILCGRQAIDGDTAQVGPEIAEHLGYPQVTYGLEAKAADDGLHVYREAEDGKEIIGVQTPCLVTFTKPSFDPRFPTIKRKIAARKAQIVHLTAAELTNTDPARVGLKGSPTKVKRTYVPPRKEAGVVVKEETVEASAHKLYELLSNAHAI